METRTKKTDDRYSPKMATRPKISVKVICAISVNRSFFLKLSIPSRFQEKHDGSCPWVSERQFEPLRHFLPNAIWRGYIIITMGSCEGTRPELCLSVARSRGWGIDESIANTFLPAVNGPNNGKGNTWLSRLSDVMGPTVSIKVHSMTWVKYILGYPRNSLTLDPK